MKKGVWIALAIAISIGSKYLQHGYVQRASVTGGVAA
jgi:hypothetical protein